MRTILCLIIVLAFVYVSPACLNEMGPGVPGPADFQESLSVDLKSRGAKMEAKLRGSTDYNDRSDYGIALIYLGRYDKAIALFEQLEKESPGHYFIAANLGTAYELSGQNDKAWHWINEGIRRNPQDHEGTEWLHAKILEAKIAQQKDPAHFEKHSVLGLQLEKVPAQISVGDQKLSPKELTAAIRYQLVERLQFVKAPDAAVASLLVDYAILEAAAKSTDSAKSILSVATDYGYPAAKATALRTKFERGLTNVRIQKYATWGVLGLVGTGILGLLWQILASSAKRPQRA